MEGRKQRDTGSVPGDYIGATTRFHSLIPCLEVQEKYYLFITGLITLLITPLNYLIGVTPIISRLITPVINSSKSHEAPALNLNPDP